MSAAIEPSDLGRFRGAVALRLGLHFDSARLALLAEVLERRVSASGFSVHQYLERVENAASSVEEFRELARDLTVGETYFFRHIEQFRAFAEVALPARLSVRQPGRQLRILSAGCASGEEAYSLAILARESGLDLSTDVRIQAVDVNPAMLERATKARFAAWSLRETPPELQRRWFVAQGREFTVDSTIRTAVTFEEQNLARADSALWLPNRYDIVFCRNVIMYFAPENARQLVGRMTAALAPGGYLFLGHAETLRGLSQDFHLRHSHGTFYYQRKDGASRPVADDTLLDAPEELPATSVPDPGWSATWIETIQRAADRIKSLSEQTSSPDPEHPVAEFRRGTDVGAALDLLKQERFAEALVLLGGLPRTSARDPELMLLRAVLLAHSGELGAAERVCNELLLLDELSAGAHYLLALCAEGLGDRKRAVDHDQTAAYLDPAFAMPRLHLGLLARRTGDRETAQRELGVALTLLEREEVSRLLLFGGGFGRDSLLALCRAELGRLGAKT